eukprot:TRINITY_DN7452_c0_g2_i2.p1 TRINITY_DN7452_c0_g2~~TRINITY_DN7452_c0_g2_i2.p1  ORF type:complete len:564 (-),score=111.85 TRINITY_DN7452_c0_g2_i2:74-1765(-)
MEKKVVGEKNFEEIDQKLGLLEKAKGEWLKVSFAEKIKLLKRVLVLIEKNKDKWVKLALQHRRLTNNEQEEELAGGVMPTVRLCRLLIEVYKPAAQAQKAGKPITFAKPPKVSGKEQKSVTVFPWGMQEKILFPGLSAEIILEKGKEASQGTELLEAMKEGKGQVSLVLGAGNQSSIPFMDALYKLYNQGQVVILKHNPVNEYLQSIFDIVFAPFIERNFFHHVVGGAEEGAYLVDRVDNIHITGSDRTHDIIVWGGLNKKEAEKPKLTKEITSELGCVTPWIIVPGPWKDNEIEYQIQQITGATVQNVSFNCNAAKLLVLHKGWELRDKLMKGIKNVLSGVPRRYAYYVGASKRFDEFLKNYPNAEKLGKEEEKGDYLPWTVIENVPPKEGEYALCNEPFCPLLSETELEADSVEDFLQKAVYFCNEKVWGNLSCTILIHPTTHKKYANAVQRALDNLRYGSIGVNIWSALSYALCSPVWGAYPGNTLKDIQSGIGFVHNAFLLDHPQKSIIHAPFQFFMGTKMPYFPGHKNKSGFLNAATAWESNPSVSNMFGALYNAAWG